MADSHAAHYVPFQPGDFAFVGYDELGQPLAELLASIGLWHDPPAVATVEQAVFVPTTKLPAPNRGAGRFVYEGGLIDQHGETIPAALARRRGGRWGVRVIGEVPAAAPRIPTQAIDDENLVYLGWFHTQFGHFLLESLARTWYLRQAPPDVRVLYHPVRSPVPTGVIRTILDAFGLPPERVLVPTQPTLLRRVTIPQPLFELSYAAHARMAEPYREVAARLLGSPPVSSQPVYLSRRLLPASRRQIIGEMELEDILRENGFLIAHPETMPFLEQMRLFNTHAQFLTSAGSAIYGALFAMSPLEFHVMAAGVPRHDYFLMPKAIGATTTYINCFEYGGRPHLNTSPLLLNLDRLLDHLTNAGLLTRQTRATITRLNHRWQSRFDEEWYYAAIRDVPILQPIPPDLLEEALARAESSWPLTFALLQNHVVRQHLPTSEALSDQLVRLLRAETSPARLLHYYEDVQVQWSILLSQVSPAVGQRLVEAFAERYGLDITVLRNRATQKFMNAMEQATPIAGLRYLDPPAGQ